MIHEIFPQRFQNDYRPDVVPGGDDYVLCYSENAVWLKTRDEGYELPKLKDIPELSPGSDLIFLFTYNDVPCFLLRDYQLHPGSGFVLREITFFRTVAQQEIAWLSLVGYHLFNWYRQNIYCGKCGGAMHPKKEERAITCPGCRNIIYPGIAPAVIVAIISGNKILLARNAGFPGNWYSLIAGYVDVGESLEETVVREVKEEVGIDVKNIRYYKSQPWPLSGSVMIGFVAEADSLGPILPDGKEITEAAWFSRGNLPPHPLNLSIAGEMIERFNNGKL